jgi:hypothetical protein
MAQKEWYRQTSEWYRRTSTRWVHFRSVPIKRLWVLIAAVFLLFSVYGFYFDLMNGGVLPYAVVLQIALYVGLNASLWVIVLSRLSMPFLVGLIVLQFFNTLINTSLAHWMTRSFDLKPVPSELGIHFAATATLSAIILSYVCEILATAIPPTLDSETPKRCKVVGIFPCASSNGQQTVAVYLVLCAYIYMPVHDRRDVEP